MCFYDFFGIKQYRNAPHYVNFILANTYSGIRFCVDINNIKPWFLDFLKIFSSIEIESGVNTLVMRGIYDYSESVRSKITLFISQNNKTDSRINDLGKWIKWMKFGEKFVFSPYTKNSDILKIKSFLMEQNIPNFVENRKYVEEYIQEISCNYAIKVFDYRTRALGESDKNKRCCLFCGKTGLHEFQQKAHAISESLGNKWIVQNEECDACNNYFGKNVEQDFADYMEMFRVLYKVQGKNGVPQNDKYYSSDNSFHIVVKPESDVCQQDLNISDEINIDSQKKVNFQNLYKSLVLYAVSLIGNENKDALKNTCQWLRGKINILKLPKVSYSIQTGLWRDYPWAICYVRKNDDRSLPQFVIEFHFLFFVFVAIVPQASGDDRAFTKENDYNHFWESMPHFRKSVGWVTEDWSSNERKDLKYFIKMVKHS